MTPKQAVLVHHPAAVATRVKDGWQIRLSSRHLPQVHRCKSAREAWRRTAKRLKLNDKAVAKAWPPNVDRGRST